MPIPLHPIPPSPLHILFPPAPHFSPLPQSAPPPPLGSARVQRASKGGMAGVGDGRGACKGVSGGGSGWGGWWLKPGGCVQGEATLVAEKNRVMDNGRSGFAVTMYSRARSGPARPACGLADGEGGGGFRQPGGGEKAGAGAGAGQAGGERGGGEPALSLSLSLSQAGGERGGGEPAVGPGGHGLGPRRPARQPLRRQREVRRAVPRRRRARRPRRRRPHAQRRQRPRHPGTPPQLADRLHVGPARPAAREMRARATREPGRPGSRGRGSTAPAGAGQLRDALWRT